MLQRIEEDFTVAFKQRIEQIKAGNVRWWIQPVIKPSAAGKNLQMTIKQHNDAQPKPERRCGDSGNGHYSHQMIQPAISPDCREYAQRDANQECQQQGTKSQLQRRREKYTQLFQHRTPGTNGCSQVTMKQVADVEVILYIQWLVQSQLLANIFLDSIAGAVTRQ